MRRRGKLVFWPAYFESSLTWGQGRRVSKKLSLRGVKAVEVFRAAEDLGLNPLMDEGAAYPKAPWMRSGVVLVDKTGKKSEVMVDLAQRIRSNRANK